MNLWLDYLCLLLSLLILLATMADRQIGETAVAGFWVFIFIAIIGVKKAHRHS